MCEGYGLETAHWRAWGYKEEPTLTINGPYAVRRKGCAAPTANERVELGDPYRREIQIDNTIYPGYEYVENVLRSTDQITGKTLKWWPAEYDSDQRARA